MITRVQKRRPKRSSAWYCLSDRARLLDVQTQGPNKAAQLVLRVTHICRSRPRLCRTGNRIQQPGALDSHVGELGGGEGAALNRAEQPAIHMDQVDKLSINGLPLESETWAQAREELLREITIAAAIQVSL